MPYAAPTESRLSRIALIGITIERNVNNKSRNASENTNPKISGRRSLTSARKSFDWAALPLTFTVAPSTLPIVAGTISSRISSRAAVDCSSLPLPLVGMETSATVPSLL